MSYKINTIDPERKAKMMIRAHKQRSRRSRIDTKLYFSTHKYVAGNGPNHKL